MRTFQTINEGATLKGTRTANRVDLTVLGQTFDLERRFKAHIVATRVAEDESSTDARE
jgi:hypothetical protein